VRATTHVSIHRFGKSELLKFVFALADEDASGYVSYLEFMNIVNILHPYEKRRAKRALRELRLKTDSHVSIVQFMDINER
jgi:Ca2+-binding EF-hand superfamily protein